MKFLSADLLADTTTVYDQTKTTLYGRVQSRTVDGDLAMGPPLNRFVDVVTDLGVIPSVQGMFLTRNGRLFHISAISAGSATLTLHNIDLMTSITTPVGKLNLTFPNNAATTHVIRSLKIYDNDPTNIRVMVQTTASIVTNGGLFVANKINVSDFTMITSVTLLMATSTDQKAVYFYQRTSEMGPANLMTSGTGLVMDYTNATVYFHNGTSTTHQYYKFDLSIPPLVAGTFTGVTVTAATPAVVTVTAHGYSANSRIVFTSGTLPTGLTLNTVYFVKTPTANTFNLSLTVGGANINTTGVAGSGLTIMHAFGESNSGFVLKTGNLPALTGTLLNTDSEDFATPQHGPISTLAQDCAFFSTQSNLYLGKLSDLVNASTAWSSLSTVNVLGAANEVTVPTPIYASWSNSLDCVVYSTSGSILIVKKFINSQFLTQFGGTNTRYLEGLVGLEAIELQFLTAVSLDIENGYLAITGGTTGQRGTYLSDIRSDVLFDYSHIITKVLSTGGGSAKFISTLDKLFDFTGSLEVYYRTSGFGVDTGGWLPIDFATDLGSILINDEIQFDIYFATLGLDTCIPAQLVDFNLGYDPLSEISAKWRGSVDNSSREGESPYYSAFRMIKSDSGTKIFRAYSDSNVLVESADTQTNFADFDYSTDNGATWTQLPSANAYPATALTTELRYKWAATPAPGTKITVSLRDS